MSIYIAVDRLEKRTGTLFSSVIMIKVSLKKKQSLFQRPPIQMYLCFMAGVSAIITD